MSHIARSTLILAVFFALDKILGFFRQVLIARQFRLTYDIDVFNAANNIPDLLSALISGGALGVALIPVLSEFIELRSRQAAWDLFSRILNLAFLVTASIALGIAIFAQPLVSEVIVPGFPAEQQALTVELMRLDLIAILIFSISGLVMAGLQANQHFLLPAMAPGLYNLGQIFGVAILSPSQGLQIGGVQLPAFNLGIHGLVYGVILGACLHLLIQIPALIKYGFRWNAQISLCHPGVVKVLKLLGPRVVTMFFLQIFFIARDNLASNLGEGSVTALNYGWFIMQVPETLIGSALAIVLLPTISEHFARNDLEKFGETINKAFRLILALTLPVATLLAMTIPALVRSLFGFDAAETQLVVWVTRAYLLGLMGHSLLETAARSFYAQQDAITPLWAAAVNAGGYILFAVNLAPLLGAPGIALANTLAFTGEAFLLIFLLRRRLRNVLNMRSTLVRTLLGSTVAGLIALGATQIPLPPFHLAILALLIGGTGTLPFILPELRILIKW